MPGFDRTGPSGRGPMTGRGRGWCIVGVDDREKTVGFGFGCRGGRTGNGARFAGRRRMAGVRAGVRRMENACKQNETSNASFEESVLVQKVVETLDSIAQKLDQLTAATGKRKQEESA